MPPKIKQADLNVAESLGLEFGTPPERDTTRRSKHDERWQAARELCQKYPGQALRVLTYNQPSQPYSIAKQINNGDHRYFTEDYAEFTAVAAKNHDDNTYSIWLTYNPGQSE